MYGTAIENAPFGGHNNGLNFLLILMSSHTEYPFPGKQRSSRQENSRRGNSSGAGLSLVSIGVRDSIGTIPMATPTICVHNSMSARWVCTRDISLKSRRFICLCPYGRGHIVWPEQEVHVDQTQQVTTSRGEDGGHSRVTLEQEMGPMVAVLPRVSSRDAPQRGDSTSAEGTPTRPLVLIPLPDQTDVKFLLRTSPMPTNAVNEDGITFP